MDANAAKSSVESVPPLDKNIEKAAAEFLASSTERRKRARPPTDSNGTDQPRKKIDTSKPSTINVEVARKAATELMRESPSYQKLVKMEEKLDLAIMTKQQSIKETLKSNLYSESRTFRLYLFNTYRSQPESEGTTPDDVPSWSLRIQGHLLPKTDEPSTIPQGIHVANNPSSPAASQNTSVGIASMMITLVDPTVPPLHNTPISSSTPQQSILEIPQYPNAQNASPTTSMPNLTSPSDSQTILRGPPPKCSDIFKRIVIELDKGLYPENNLIEWRRNDMEPSSDGFEISRAGSTEFTARVFLYVDHKPEQFRLSYALSRLIGVRNDTKKGIFAGVWQYIKKMRLQCVDDRSAVRLDSGLKGLLGPTNANVEVMKIQQLFAVIKSHMVPPEPLMIEYQVMFSGDVVDNQDCYDVRVNVQDTSLIESARRAGVFGLDLPHSAEFEALREKHMSALARIAEHKKRRDFFQGFSSNPVQFINHLILSQTRDLKVLGGSTGRNTEEERRAAFYQQQWVHEAVPRYLLRKSIADTAEDTLENGSK